jgi:hypothetical protein
MSTLGRLARIGITLAIVLASQLAFVQSTAAQQPNTASLSGVATDSKGQVLPQITVRLRNVDTNAIVATTISDDQGKFVFVALPAGNFVVEVVDQNQKVIAATAAIAVSSGATIAGINVSAGAAAIAGTAAATAAAVGTGGIFGSTAAIVAIAAASVGVTAAVVAVGGDSPTFTPGPPIAAPPPTTPFVNPPTEPEPPAPPPPTPPVQPPAPPAPPPTVPGPPTVTPPPPPPPPPVVQPPSPASASQ